MLLRAIHRAVRSIPRLRDWHFCDKAPHNPDQVQKGRIRHFRSSESHRRSTDTDTDSRLRNAIHLHLNAPDRDRVLQAA